MLDSYNLKLQTFTADLLKEGDFPWFDRDFLLLWKRQEKKNLFSMQFFVQQPIFDNSF